MKKKALLASAFISALLISAIAGTLLVNFATANPLPQPEISYTVTIQSPENKVYTTSNILLTFKVDFAVLKSIGWLSVELSYTLDEQEPVSFPGPQKAQSGDSYPFSTQLSGLSEGSHSLTVTVVVNYLGYGRPDGVNGGRSDVLSDPVAFVMDAHAPRVSLLSLKQQATYGTTALPLDFTVSEPVTWTGYSLDGHETVTIEGNTTLTGLSEGTHSLTVYVKDIAGTTAASQPVQFNVTQETETPGPQPEPEQSIIPLAAAAGTVAAVASAGFILYFKKKHP